MKNEVFLSQVSVSLRPTTLKDCQKIAKACNNQTLTVYMTTGNTPITHKSCVDHHAEVVRNGGLSFSIYFEEALKGVIELNTVHQINRSGRISILIFEPGQGIGSIAIGLLTDHCFNRLNLHRLEAGACECNIGCIHAFEKAGYKNEARLRDATFVRGKYRDIIILSKVKG